MIKESLHKEDTDRQEAEDNLKHLSNRVKELTLEARKRSEQINAILASVPDPLIIYDIKGNIVNASESASDSLGIDLIGLNMDNIIKLFSIRKTNGKRVTRDDVVSERALRGETIKDRRFLITDIKGEERVVLVSSAPIKTEDKIIGSVTMWRDITDQERTEMDLKKARSEMELQVIHRSAELVEANRELNKEIKEHRETSALLEKIFSNTHFLIAYLDTSFNFIRVNHAYARADGRIPDFYLGKNHFDLYPNEENEAIFRKVLETGETYITYAKPFVYEEHPERGVTYWDWSLQPIKDTSGKVEALVICLVDVTERKQAEEKLIKAQKELNDAKRLSEIGSLAATVAHELRNPLAVIETAAYNISRKRKNLKLDPHLESIELSITESDAIINNLLFYSRIKIPNYQNIYIYELLNECIKAFEKRPGRKKILIEKKYGFPGDILIEADPYQLKEVFLNILNNAFDALKDDGGRIEIGTESDCNDIIKLYFKDNGCGIDEGDLVRIKEPFFSKKSHGTGLGLAVCNQIITLHMGTIDIESKKGHGTNLLISLPVKKKYNDQ